jgi:acylphosphatase
MPKSYRFVVTGRVQGVFFRQSTKQRADALGLQGWVRNRDDGAVEGTVHGTDAAALDAFRDWLNRGPQRAQVQGVRWEDCEESSPEGFEVRH